MKGKCTVTFTESKVLNKGLLHKLSIYEVTEHLNIEQIKFLSFKCELWGFVFFLKYIYITERMSVGKCCF